MSHNLATKSQEELEKMYVELAAGAVVFKEKYNEPVIPEHVEREQPAHLQEYFRACLTRFRSMRLGSMPRTP